mmetsp:Transcript_8230/g.21872  ORF Transcript_8230/g.21872 Transcript_8230/m.21872 type:complete len:180 (-) Transcript_8230:969-1508(-)
MKERRQAERTLHGASLVIAVPATGNVAQLALDLIISSYYLNRASVLVTNYVYPLVGTNALDERTYSFGIETFDDEKHKICFVQQRSTWTEGCANAYAKELTEWIRDRGFSSVTIATGFDSTLRHDTQLQCPNQSVFLYGRCKEQGKISRLAASDIVVQKGRKSDFGFILHDLLERQGKA